jgi:hypothetical protein
MRDCAKRKTSQDLFMFRTDRNGLWEGKWTVLCCVAKNSLCNLIDWVDEIQIPTGAMWIMWCPCGFLASLPNPFISKRNNYMEYQSVACTLTDVWMWSPHPLPRKRVWLPLRHCIWQENFMYTLFASSQFTWLSFFHRMTATKASEPLTTRSVRTQEWRCRQISYTWASGMVHYS